MNDKKVERPSFGDIYITDKYKIWGWNTIIIMLGIIIFGYGIDFLMNYLYSLSTLFLAVIITHQAGFIIGYIYLHESILYSVILIIFGLFLASLATARVNKKYKKIMYPDKEPENYKIYRKKIY